MSGDITFMMRLSLTGRHRTGTTFPIWFDVIRSHHGNTFEYIGRVSFAGNPEKVSEMERVEIPPHSASAPASATMSTNSFIDRSNTTVGSSAAIPATLTLPPNSEPTIASNPAQPNRPLATTSSSRLQEPLRVDPLLSSDELFSDAQRSSSNVNVNIQQPTVPRSIYSFTADLPKERSPPTSPTLPHSNSLAPVVDSIGLQDEGDSSTSNRSSPISKPTGAQKTMRFSPSVQSRHGLGDGPQTEPAVGSLWRSNSRNSASGNGDAVGKPSHVGRARGGSAQFDGDSPITAARKGGTIMSSLVVANTLSPMTSSGTIPSVSALASGSNVILSPRLFSSLGRQSMLRTASPLQNSIAFDGESTTTRTDPASSVAHESTASRAGSREARMILTWKAARFNPLYRMAGQRIQFGFLILLASTITVMIVMSGIQQAIQPSSLDDLSVVSLFNKVALHSELLHFCHQAGSSTSSNLEWAQSICTHTDSRSTLKALSYTLGSLPQQLFTLAHREPDVASAVQTPWTFDQFISPDPTVATKVLFQDFWEITARVASASNSSASIVGDPTLNRHWRFLVANKDVLHQAASGVSKGILASIESD
ncbi:hypothetical protein BCR44DRAFT_1176376 [Catenaria anguillulae PL171]|uniref:Uncharacterized protein n=1 Tax=Catenaria anguillulae PL171 TaxID=765915 RepID=A0A1Y2I124_9FUNG|nr:hypothetical protein BCR44DRAFT_1176376 [Catenaria anguillulae PL171]